MLGQEKPNKSSRWVRLSISATVLLVVVVCAVAFSSNAPSSLGQKNMVAGVDNEPYDGDFDMTDTVPHADEPAPEMDGEEFEDAEPTDENEDDGDDIDEDVEEDGATAVENDLPKKVKLCNKVCRHLFKGRRPRRRRKRRACKKDCKADYGDHTKPRKCFKDCKKACIQLASPGKLGYCLVKCEKTFCPRPLKFCINMCRVLGKKQFKKPVGKNIGKCKLMCKKDKLVRSRPRRCHLKCMQACRRFAKKRGKCRGDCKMLCPEI